MKPIVSIFAICCCLTVMAERQPFDRYQSIVDRQMFGAPPPGFDPTKMPSEVQKGLSEKELTQEQEKIRSAIRFSVINVDSDGRVEVGFTDNSDPQNVYHYFIKEGETAGGWTVEKADADNATMTISKDGISLDMALGDDSAGGAGNAKRNDSGGRGPTRQRSLLAGLRTGGGAQSAGGDSGSRLSFRERREQEIREREERENKRREEDKAQRDQMQQELQAMKTMLEESRRSREAQEAAAQAKDGAAKKESENGADETE